MTSNKIGVNLRVSGNSSQGGRRYMEDTHATRFIKQDGKDYEFAYFGIFDGHGGPEASRFARDNLLDEITKYDAFWSENDEDIMWAIRNGFLDTHQAMWREVDKWPKTWSGLPSTAGTTASVAIIKNSKLYIGHVGDSGIVLGVDKGPPNAVFMEAKCLTREHKPDSPEEKSRIEECGGAVVAKSGVQRVVWSRPKVYHKGPIRRSTQIDKIPFLAVARSLGDLWSYDYLSEKFVVSPEPDVCVHQLDPQKHKCLVLASDGLWNMLKPEESVAIVSDLEMQFEDRVINDPTVPLSYWVNPAERLVTKALNKWRARMMKADNTSAIVVLIDPLGPSKLSILKRKREEATRSRLEVSPTSDPVPVSTSSGAKSPIVDKSDAAAQQAHTPHQPNIPTTPKSAPPKLSSKALSGGCEEKPVINKKKDTSICEKNVKRLTLPTLQSDVLEDSIQLLSALKNTPAASTASTVPPISSAASKLPALKSDGFTSIKDSSILAHSDASAHKLGPWPCSNSPDVRQADNTDVWPLGKSCGENVRTRSMSGPSAPAPGVLCQQKLHSNDKNKAPNDHDRFSVVVKPSRLSVNRILRHQGENNMLKDKKARTGKGKIPDFVVSRFEGVNKNNSNDASHSCSKQRSKHCQGLKRKTRRTLRRAKDVAKRAMCLENSLFLGGKGLRNPNSVKRKMEDCSSGPVAKRLRRSDVQRFQL